MYYLDTSRPAHVCEYKKILRKEIRLSDDEEIILTPELGFEAAKSILMVLDDNFRDFCHFFSLLSFNHLFVHRS